MDPLGDQVLELRAAARRLARQAATLRALGPERAARAGEQACALLADAEGTLGRALRHELVARSGLSAPLVSWGLDTSLAAWRTEEALALFHAAPREPGEPVALLAVVLAGNVFGAPVRTLLLPLVAGVPVLAKGASADDVVARYLGKALRRVDPDVGAGAEVVTFARGELGLEAALLDHASLVRVHGDDDTVERVRARVGARVPVLAHGHGLGIGFVAGDSLCDEPTARSAALSFAFDVAAYDQRGCLSPHALFVERGAAVGPERFAELLADALLEVERRWPRGPLVADLAPLEMQWRGVAVARGVLFERGRAAVSYEAHHPLRPSPGARNVGVYACRDEHDLADRLRALGRHLKALGVAADPAARARFASLAPYVCAAGAMQTPPLSAPLDGLHPFAGLVRRR